MPPCGGREGGGDTPPPACLLGSSPRHDGDFGWRNVVFFCFVYNAFSQEVMCSV